MSVGSDAFGGLIDSRSSSPGMSGDEESKDESSEELIDESFACSMCNQKYQDPRILSCLHVNCLKCLKTLMCSDGNEIKCPDCQQVTKLGPGGEVADLQEDHVMVNALDMAAILNMQTVCTSCKAKEKAVARCSDCANFLCPNCVTAHQFMRCFENHKVVAFDEMKSTEGYSIHKPLFCKKHPTEGLKYFCEACQMPVCTECVVTEHKLPDHETQRLTELGDTCVEGLRALSREAGSKRQRCEEATSNLETALSDLQTQRDGAKEAILDTYQRYRAVLENTKDEALLELEVIHSDQENHIMDVFHHVGKTLEKIEDGCHFTDRMLASGNTTEILLTKKLISSQLMSLINTNTPTDRTTKIEFVTQPAQFEACVKNYFGTFNTSTLDKEKSTSSGSLHSSFEKEGIQMPPGPLNSGEGLELFPPVTEVDFMTSLAAGLPPLSVHMTTAVASQVAASSAVSPHTINSIASSLQNLSSAHGCSNGGGGSSGLPPASMIERSLSRNSYSPAMSDSGISVGAASNSSGSNQPVVNVAALAKLGAVNVNAQGQITLNGHVIPCLTMNNVSGLSQVLASRASTPSTPLSPDMGLGGLLGGISGNLSASQNSLLIKPGTPQIGDITHFLSQPALLSPGASIDSSQGQPGFSLQSQPSVPIRGSNKVNSMQIACKFGQLGPGKAHFSSPHGFCLGVDEDIVIADTNNHRIQVYDKTGDFKYQFGIPGPEEGQLWYPRKVSVMLHSGKYIVCDRGKERSRMQIFTKNGHFLKKIAIRYIDIVAGVAINHAGQIVAVDSVSPTIFVIAETGDLVKWFDCSDYMREPSDISVKDKEYFVCDFKGHCVVVFSDEGQFLRRIGCENITNFPNGIDISNEGDILIGDSHGNRFHVAIFQKEGSLIGEFECPYVKVSRCCGLKITSEGYIVTLAKNNHHVLVLNPLYLF